MQWNGNWDQFGICSTSISMKSMCFADWWTLFASVSLIVGTCSVRITLDGWRDLVRDLCITPAIAQQEFVRLSWWFRIDLQVEEEFNVENWYASADAWYTRAFPVYCNFPSDKLNCPLNWYLECISSGNKSVLESCSNSPWVEQEVTEQTNDFRGAVWRTKNYFATF